MKFILKEFLETAYLLSQENLVHSYIGNLSKKRGKKFFMTRTGYSQRSLSEEDVIVLPFERFSVLFSFKVEKIEPVDCEGGEVLKSVPVVNEREHLVKAFNENNIVVLEGHGVFSVGNSLLEAYELISILENSSKILWRLEYGGKV